MRRASAFLTGVLLLFTLSACETEQAEIEPAPGVEQAEGMMGAAVTDVAGIHMTVQPDAWTGDAPISEEVTPLRVQIENGSGSPLEVQYPHFTLVTSEGEVYAALPPFAVEGEVAEPVLMQEYDPIEEPFFDYDAFGVYPYYTPVYPGVAAYDADFDYDPDYYVEYYTYWEDVELPTAEMLQHALPEGVVSDGGRVSGFLYFEELDPDILSVIFRADLVNAETDAAMGEISIPFRVYEEEVAVR